MGEKLGPGAKGVLSRRERATEVKVDEIQRAIEEVPSEEEGEVELEADPDGVMLGELSNEDLGAAQRSKLFGRD